VVGSVQDASDDFRTMLAALRAAVEAPGADHPGRLRGRLDAALGPEDSARLRRLVHQVVAAAEENLPHDLRRIAPLTPQSLHRLSQDLGDARGWTPDAARRTTQLWASALGFSDLAASSWPREPEDPRPALALAPDATQLPQQPALGVRRDVAPVAWPATPKTFRSHTATRSGEPALGAALGYAGMSLPLCVTAAITLTVVLCLPVFLIGPTGFLLPLLGVLGGRVLVSRLGRGAVVASESWIEFTPYDASLRKPRPERAFGAPWSQVEVEQDTVSVLRLAGRRVQLGPRNRAFAAAVAQRVEGAR
jgi:hypothetical protein